MDSVSDHVWQSDECGTRWDPALPHAPLLGKPWASSISMSHVALERTYAEAAVMSVSRAEKPKKRFIDK